MAGGRLSSSEMRKLASFSWFLRPRALRMLQAIYLKNPTTELIPSVSGRMFGAWVSGRGTNTACVESTANGIGAQGHGS